MIVMKMQRASMYRPPAGRWRVPAVVLVAAAVLLLGLFHWAQARLGFQVGGSLAGSVPGRVAGPLPGSLPGSMSGWGTGRLPGSPPGLATGVPGAPGGFETDVQVAERRAVALMAEGLRIIARAREAAGYPVDAAVDPNMTGLIGAEWSSITTTLGDLQAKRTATNPLWAAYVVRRMAEAGVRPGDVVWAAFSGSFPGFNLAVLAAAEAMGVELYAVSSLSASTWGANLPGFTWIDMEAALREAGLFRGGTVRGTVAVTFGGDYDRGPELFSVFADEPGQGVAALRAAAARHPWPLLEPEDLDEAVELRIKVLAEAGGRPLPALLINAGGGHASLGDCYDVWPPGLTTGPRPCGGATPGLMHVLSQRGVPVLHLLNARALALAAGIPVDGRFDIESGF